MSEQMRDLQRVINDAEREQFAKLNYQWMEAMLRARLGAGAEEYAGVALWGALLCYDGSCPLGAWVVRKGVWIARDEMRRAHGRAGTERREFLQTTASLISDQQTIDESEPDQSIADDDALLEVIQVIEMMPAPARLILLGRVLTDFSNPQIGGLVGVNPRQMRYAIVHLQQSLQAA